MAKTKFDAVILFCFIAIEVVAFIALCIFTVYIVLNHFWPTLIPYLKQQIMALSAYLAPLAHLPLHK